MRRRVDQTQSNPPLVRAGDLAVSSVEPDSGQPVLRTWIPIAGMCAMHRTHNRCRRAERPLIRDQQVRWRVWHSHPSAPIRWGDELLERCVPHPLKDAMAGCASVIVVVSMAAHGRNDG